MARLVARWARLYTTGLPPEIAGRRVEEIDADVHDHIAHERARGTSERRIALGVASRMLRGVPADVEWRGDTIGRSVRRSLARVALVTAAVLLVPAAATLLTDGPGWGVFDFVFAAVLLGGSGLLLELAVRRPRNLASLVVAAVIGAAAIVFGDADDAPGLVLFGGLLIAGTLVLAVRTAQRSS
jgi:hypothetical protein